MKKWLAMILAMILVLSLCACDGKKEAKLEGLNVGFGRADMTPDFSIGLHGYFGGVLSRMSQGVHAPIMATCIAITDADGETVLLYTVDIIALNSVLTAKYRPKVAEATGVPEKNILAAGTHTHSGPSPTTGGDYWDTTFVDAMVKAGKDAMADRSPVTVKAGATNIEHMNFVRHYITEKGVVIGDNFGSVAEDGKRVAHATDVDDELQVIYFTRKDKKDIVMINWQGHAKCASTNETEEGRALRNFLSSDYIGSCRKYLEEGSDDLLFAFYLGASGNVNVNSKLKEEMINCPTHVDAYGKQLGDHVLALLPELEDQGQPDIRHASTDYMATQPSGAQSPLELGTVLFGNMAFVTAPYEMFDTDGMNVKNGSPAEYTFIMTVANGHSGYMPSSYAFSYDGAYEVTSTRFVQGTAEACAEEMVKQLNALAGK